MAVGAYALTTLQRVKDWLNLSTSAQDTTLERLIDAATARIETWCGRQFLARDRVEAHNGSSRTLKLKHYPVNSIKFLGYGRESAIIIASDESTDILATVGVLAVAPHTSAKSVVLTRTNANEQVTATTYELVDAYTTTLELATQITSDAGWTATALVNCPSKYLHVSGPMDAKDGSVTLTWPSQRSSRFNVDMSTGVLTMPSGYRDREWADEFDDVDDYFQTVIVDYNAGYSTVPDDVGQACIELVAAAYRARFKDANVDSETLGDYSYTSAVRDAQQDLLDNLLGSWKEIR